MPPVLASLGSLVGSIVLVYWMWSALSTTKVLRSVPLLDDLTPPEPKAWPRVSVIVPACNEAASLEAAMRSRLAEGYPNAEYIVVDDRSSDGTGAIVDRLAAEDPRVVPIHVEALPEGWLGKVHAMHAGIAKATGSFILFSDADIHHEPGTLSRVVAICEERKLDHVALFPSVWSSGFVVDAVMNTFLRLIVVGSRAWKVTDPKSRIALGGGTFGLVRRSALERAGGLEPFRLEVIDDLALGQALKWSGARQAVFNARSFVGLHYYRSVGEVIRGLEKNAFAAFGRYRVAQFLAAVGLIAVAELGPYVMLALAAAGVTTSLVGLVALGVVVLATATEIATARWLRRPLLPTAIAPLGTAIFVVAALRSMILALSRGGVEWRGTRYSLAALRSGMRYQPF